jgi:hypothetical protein
MDTPLHVCSYEDRSEAMDGLILMGESLCLADPGITLHLTVPNASAAVHAWAAPRPNVSITSERPVGVSGWDVKPWLLLQELNAGREEVLWLDTDMIVTRAISPLFRKFPRDSLILSEEWSRMKVPVSHLWGLRSVRLIWLFNACVVRATQAHRPLLERWLEMLRAPSYRHAQTLPFESRPVHMIHDGWVLLALLESEEFSGTRFDCLRAGRDIAQCAGSSGYHPYDRVLNLFRGQPPIIHGLGRKPWDPPPRGSSAQRFLFDFAIDVSPYVLAARKVALGLGMTRDWLNSRTWIGAALRGCTHGHPALAGLPLAIPHSALRTAQTNRAREHDRLY